MQEHTQSYYADTLAYQDTWPSLEGDHDCDVCVIGGGFTGISSALNLAEKGYRVTLLESHRMGWGASGRNGGQAGGMPRHDVEDLEKQLGLAVAKQQWQLNQAALAELKQRIKQHEIACDWKPGIITTCHRPKDEDWFKHHVEKLVTEYGAEHVAYISGAQMKSHIDSPVCFGGMIDRSSGHIHPLNFALGLARAATEAGAALYEHSHVTGISQQDPAIIKTDKGSVKARYVVLACNGYLEKLEPRLAGKIMPINNFILATQPLGKAMTERLIREDSAVCDTKFVVNYWRLSKDKRLLFGGGENYTRRFPGDIKNFVRRYMLEVYPYLANTRIDYGWGGTLAVTMNRQPSFGRLPPNMFYAQGYSGHGVVLASFAGKLIAEAVAGDAERFDMMAELPVPTFPGGTLLRWPGLVAGMLYYSLRDRLGL